MRRYTRTIRKTLAYFLFTLGLYAIGLTDGIQPGYVDLDGDGIDDHALDANDDGIPDKFASGYIAPRSDLNEMTLKLPSSLSGSSRYYDAIPTTRLQHFGQRYFFARGLESCRSNIESKFSSGIGIGIGGGGGPCAGGVCF